MDKDDRPSAGEDQIGLSRKVLPVQPEPIAQPMSDRPDNQFRLRILGANERHLATFFGIYFIGHGVSGEMW